MENNMYINPREGTVEEVVVAVLSVIVVSRLVIKGKEAQR
jgi:hypothetical protein